MSTVQASLSSQSAALVQVFFGPEKSPDGQRSGGVVSGGVVSGSMVSGDAVSGDAVSGDVSGFMSGLCRSCDLSAPASLMSGPLSPASPAPPSACAHSPSSIVKRLQASPLLPGKVFVVEATTWSLAFLACTCTLAEKPPSPAAPRATAKEVSPSSSSSVILKLQLLLNVVPAERSTCRVLISLYLALTLPARVMVTSRAGGWLLHRSSVQADSSNIKPRSSRCRTWRYRSGTPLMCFLSFVYSGALWNRPGATEPEVIVSPISLGKISIRRPQVFGK